MWVRKKETSWKDTKLIGDNLQEEFLGVSAREKKKKKKKVIKDKH